MKGFGENKNKNSNKSNLVKSDKDKFLKSQIDLAKNYLLSGDILEAKKIYSQLRAGYKSIANKKISRASLWNKKFYRKC